MEDDRCILLPREAMSGTDSLLYIATHKILYLHLVYRMVSRSKQDQGLDD